MRLTHTTSAHTWTCPPTVLLAEGAQFGRPASLRPTGDRRRRALGGPPVRLGADWWCGSSACTTLRHADSGHCVLTAEQPRACCELLWPALLTATAPASRRGHMPRSPPPAPCCGTRLAAVTTLTRTPAKALACPHQGAPVTLWRSVWSRRQWKAVDRCLRPPGSPLPRVQQQRASRREASMPAALAWSHATAPCLWGHWATGGTSSWIAPCHIVLRLAA